MLFLPPLEHPHCEYYILPAPKPGFIAIDPRPLRWGLVGYEGQKFTCPRPSQLHTPMNKSIYSNLKKGNGRLSWCQQSMNTSLDFFNYQSIGIGQNNNSEKSGVFTPLDKDSIHIWSAQYKDLEQYLPFVRDILSQQEREKSADFLKPADAKRYILRHGMLRYILSTYTDTDPALLPLVNGIRGKPGLSPNSDFHEISFSLSHADQVVFVGIVKDHSIGIDIVKTDPGYPFHDITEYLFTPMEKEFVQRIEPGQRYLMFFKI